MGLRVRVRRVVAQVVREVGRSGCEAGGLDKARELE